MDNQAALALVQRFMHNKREFDGTPTRDRFKLIPRIVNVAEWAEKGPLSGETPHRGACLYRACLYRAATLLPAPSACTCVAILLPAPFACLESALPMASQPGQRQASPPPALHPPREWPASLHSPTAAHRAL